MTGEGSAAENNRVRQLFKGGAILFIGLAFELLVSFVGKLLIARFLGPVNFGSVAIGIAVATALPTIAVLGLGTGAARYIPRFENVEAKRGVARIAFILGLPAPLVLGLLTFLFAETIAVEVFDSARLAVVFRVFGPTIPLAAFGSIALGVTQGRKNSVPKTVIVHFVTPLVRIVGIGAAVTASASVFGFSLAYAVPYVISFVLWVYAVRDVIIGEFSLSGTSSEKLGMDMLAFSVPLMLSTGLQRILTDADTFLLGALKDPGAVGIYNVVYPIADLLTVSLIAMGFLFMPILSERHEAGDWQGIRRLYSMVAKWVVMLSSPMFFVFIFFPRASIRHTFGTEYLPGVFALQILALGFFIDTVAGLNRETLISIGRTKIVAKALFTAVVLNLALNVLLIPKYSFVGAAAATTISYALINVILSGVLYRHGTIQPLSWSAALPIVVTGATTGALAVLTYPVQPLRFLPFVGVVALVLFGHGIGIATFGIEQEEVLIVHSIEERFGINLEPAKRLVRRLM